MAKKRKMVSKGGKFSGIGASKLARKGRGQVRNKLPKPKARKR